MEKKFRIHKMPLDNLIKKLIELYDSGVDFVDLYADHSDPNQDKLIIKAKDEYINPDFRSSSIIETDLSDDDIDKLL